MKLDRLVVLDLEANIDRAAVQEQEIIEIGACLVENGKIVDEFESLVRPTRPLTPETVDLTGIQPSMLETASLAGDALSGLLSFLGTSAIAAYNGQGYDFPLLDASLARERLPGASEKRLDVLDLAHIAFPRVGESGGPNSDGTYPPTSRRLQELATYLGLTNEGQHHRALSDARLTVAVLNKLLALLGEQTSMRELQRWIIHAGKHPWSAFVPRGGRRALEDVIPEQPDWSRETPSGIFDPDSAICALEEGGVLMGDGRSPRRQQVRMARLVSNSLAHGGRLMVEAPTGTGKTLAYLVPAVAFAQSSGRPVVVATFTKLLQNQVMATLNELNTKLGPVRSVLLKGRENYLSLEALDAALALGPIDSQDSLALAVMAGWAAQTPTGDWHDLSSWAIDGHTPMELRRWELRVDQYPGIPVTKLDERCFYRNALARLHQADVAVLNHAVLVTTQDWRDEARAIIIDEAHNLEETATSAITEEVAEGAILRLLNAVSHPDRTRGLIYRYLYATGARKDDDAPRDVMLGVDRCRAATEEFGAHMLEYVRDRVGTRWEQVERFGASYRLRRGRDTRNPDYAGVVRACERLTEALLSLSSTLQLLPVPSQLRAPYRCQRLENEIARFARGAREAALVARDTCRCAEDTTMISIVDLALEQGRWEWGLRRVPISVAAVLNRLWDDIGTAVLTSATLQVGGDFSFLQDTLGLRDAQVQALGTPFERLREHQLVVIPDHLPMPRGGLIQEFKQTEADEVARLIMISGGRALVLFTSRDRMLFVREFVRPQLDPQQLPVLTQGEAPPSILAERMRTELSTSLLATKTFWEGLDIPGEALSLLIIEKLPFDTPDDPVISARMDALELRGKDPFSEYIVPRAALRFVQGMGRLIRSSEDIGVAVVLDKRLRKAVSYRDMFLKSLPGPPRVARPDTSHEAYELIAEHLHTELSPMLQERLQSLPTSDPWADLMSNALSPEEAQDRELVHERLATIRARFEFDEWRPGQLEVMERFLAGEDVVTVLPTGYGKSVTYQFPALLGHGLTLVISPLIALMRDQVERLRERGVTAVAAIYSGLSQSEQEEILSRAQRGDYRLLYISPERLWSVRFRTALQNVRIARVAVDEAHCVSQWGHSFRPEYAAICRAVKEIGAGSQRPPILAATATATPKVIKEIQELLELRLENKPVVRHPDRPELRYYAEDCKDGRDRDLTVLRIMEAFRGQPAIVYVPTQSDAIRISAMLSAFDHVARPYHGGMDRARRLHIEEAFRYGDLTVAVATKAFGLGIDKPDISLVLHLEMPSSIEEYVQETGRAARGALQGIGPNVGTCVLLRMPRDCRIHGHFASQSAPQPGVVRAVWSKISDQEHVYLLPERLSKEIKDEGYAAVNDIAIGLAVHYLCETGCLHRSEDVSWVGRLCVPNEAEKLINELGADQPELAMFGAEVIDLVNRMGLEYNAPTWQRELERRPEELEASLLELARRDILGFVSWQSAWHLTRVPGSEPDWDGVDTCCEARQQLVRELSRRAKKFRDEDGECRRAQMLSYLGAHAPQQCDGCDVCVPELARPWEAIQIRMEDAEEALQPKRVCLSYLASLDYRRPSIETMVRLLAGRPLRRHKKHRRDERQREDPCFGRLALLGPDGVRRVFGQLVEQELARETQESFNGRDYQSLVITEEGRRAI